MLLGWKNQYYENDYTTKCNLQIQYNPYKITNGIFSQKQKKIFTIHTETKKNPNSQTILRKKNGARGISFLTSDNTTELQPSGYDNGTKTEI